MTVRAGVVGSPARHSLSPLIHRAWLRAAGIDGEYGLYDLPADGFGDFLSRARREGLRGVNVTLPFKEEALAAADTADEAARAAGAANLLLFEDGRISARNTDGIGLLYALRMQAPRFIPHGSTAVVLGAGGAARGAAGALVLAGAKIRLVNRTRERAQAIAEALGEGVEVFGWDEVPAALAGADALINATSLGLMGKEELNIDLSSLPSGACVMDMVYRPLETALLRQARLAGHATVDGLEMLIGQAMPSFEAFFGQAPRAIDVRGLALGALA